jgi:hypothetical protein
MCRLISRDASGVSATADPAGCGGASTTIWDAVDRLVDRAVQLSDLRAHGLHLLAARRWRVLGRTVPSELAHDEAHSALTFLTIPLVLAKVRDSYDGPMLILKGPEVAARYPHPTLRPFGDIDLLVPDAEAAQRALLSAGFQKAQDPPWAYRLKHTTGTDLFANKQHCHPLLWPGLPIHIEIHRRPNWPQWLHAPGMEELFGASLSESAVGVGMSSLPRPHHALVLVAHAWVASPLKLVRDLIDIAVMSDGVAPSEIQALAGRWGMGRMWQTTVAAVDALLLGGRSGSAQQIWARHLASVRERTVLERHLERWIASFWALPPRQAVRIAATNIASDLRPAAAESWREKARRTARALQRPLTPKSEHDNSLGQEARQFRRLP